jgi:excisionase family DNA binding protein
MERVALQPTSVTLLGAANLLGCTPQEIRRLVRTDQLHAARRGRHYHIDRQAVEHYKVQRSLPF